MREHVDDVAVGIAEEEASYAPGLVREGMHDLQSEISDPLIRVVHIVDLQLALLEKRLAVRRITITVTEAARSWLADTGYDPAYGARPLRRLIQTAIGDALARMLIGGEVDDGGAVTAGEAGLRRAALEDLGAAARRAVVAATCAASY